MIQAIIRAIYNAALLLLLLLGSPWWAYLFLTRAKFRTGFGQRFFGPPSSFVRALPPGPRLWIHAVSVGEVLAVSSLVQDLRRRLPGITLVVSTTTRTGQQLARERFGASSCFYFPFDCAWSVRATFKRLSPALLVLAESEFWPNVIAAAHRRHVPILVVNARISDRSLPRYLTLRHLWKPFLQRLSLVLAQTPSDEQRLRQIGVSADRVAVGGNLKFDVRPPTNTALHHLLQQHLPAGAPLLVCGSTVAGEEPLMLAAWQRVLQDVPEAVLLIAPRHPERFPAVRESLAASPYAWVDRTRWMENPRAIAPGSVFLLDSIGELAGLYALARVAFIGGSLIPAGGHNPLEATQFGVPVVVGPHTENFRAIVELLSEQDGIVVTMSGDLADTLTQLLTDTERATAIGARGKRVSEQQTGATDRAANAVMKLVAEAGVL